MPEAAQLTGQRFGRLTVLRRIGTKLVGTRTKLALWLCACDCGNEVEAVTTRLRNGDQVSCGCAYAETLKPRPRPVFDCVCGDHCWTALNHGFVTLVSPEDRALLQERAWGAKRDRTTHGVYAAAHIGSKTERLHRLIMPNVRLIDHESGHGCDNRRSNLRPADKSRNAMNSRVQHRPKASRYKGVSNNKGRWTARLMVRGDAKHLGQFRCETRAALAYDAAALREFGKFARPNILRPLVRRGDITQ